MQRSWLALSVWDLYGTFYTSQGEMTACGELVSVRQKGLLFNGADYEVGALVVSIVGNCLLRTGPKSLSAYVSVRAHQPGDRPNALRGVLLRRSERADVVSRR